MPACIGSLLDPRIIEIPGPDHPGSALAVLGSRQDFLLDEPAHRCFADIQNFGRFFHRDLAALGALALTVRRDAAMIAQEADPRTGPAVAAPGRLAGAIEDRRNRLVGQLPGERRDEFDDIGICSPAMLAGAVLAHAHWRVVAACPSDHQVERVVLDPHHDLLDQRADDPLSGGRRRSRAVPGGLYVSAEREQALALGLGECRLRRLPPTRPARSSSARTASRRSFQRCSSSAATSGFGIDRVVLPPRPRCLVAGLLDRQLDLTLFLRILGALRFHGADRRLDTERL